MARIDKSALTKAEIIAEATKQFLEKGYSHTTVSAIAKALDMSPGNLTFHYPTKEHMLAALTDMLCRYQWQMMEEEADDGISSTLALCLELTTMASACEDDEIIKDFFLAAYTSPMCLAIIRENDTNRAKEVFKDYRSHWTDEEFAAAAVLVSGIEYAILMTTGQTPVPLETRIAGAMHNILGIYGVPEKIRTTKISKVFAMDYMNLCKRVLANFKQYVADANEQTFQDLIKH